MKTAFARCLTFCYVVAILFIVGAALVGVHYYLTPVDERPHMAQHEALKPGGVWGHGYGIIGSAMILLLFLYSARKKQRVGFRWGRLSRWLDIHIFFGIVGPLLITLHTALKFHGVVSISYFSMVAVMLSGVFGRYIYMQIPRDTRGHVLSLEEIRTRNTAITSELERLGIRVDVLRRIREITGVSYGPTSGVGAIATALVDDIAIKRRIRRARQYLRRSGQAVDSRVIEEVGRLSREQSLLQRRVAFFNLMKSVFHHWHVIHKPFAYVMVVIMFVHIIVTVLFGYRWIF